MGETLSMLFMHRMAPASLADPTTNLVADRRLAERIAGGDEAAFDELVERHFARVSGIAGKFFRQPDAAEEIHQEVFLKAFVSIGSYRGEVPLEHWLSRIAVNACYDALRRSRRRPEKPIESVADSTSDSPGPDAEAGDGASFWRQEQARIAADEMLAMLQPAERLVLTLMVLEDRSAADVADLTGWSVVNVKVRAFRARQKLKALLAPAEKRVGRKRS